MNDAGTTLMFAGALIRREDEVLMVRLREPGDRPGHRPEPAIEGPYWVLPSGDVMPGELPLETLDRRVRDEVGLVAQAPWRLLYTMCADMPNNEQVVAWTFDVEEWSGKVQPDDPDENVVEARFFPIAEAVANLERLPRPRGEPVIAHLRGEASRGAMWSYRKHSDDTRELVAWIDGAAA